MIKDEIVGWHHQLNGHGMATHSSILVWRIPRTEEPDGLISMASQRVGHDCALNSNTDMNVINGTTKEAHWKKKPWLYDTR